MLVSSEKKCSNHCKKKEYFKGCLGTRCKCFKRQINLGTASSFVDSDSNNSNGNDVDVFADFEYFHTKLETAPVNFITNF